MSPPLVHDDEPEWSVPEIRGEAIPAELRAMDQWVVWRRVARDGKVTKVPFRAELPEAEASTTDRRTWASFASALAACLDPDNRLDGIGFVFTPDDPYVGVDLDNALTADGTGLEAWAREVLRLIPGYAEVTPSGRGLHLIARGECPGGKGRRRGGLMPAGGGIEVYDRGRYFTFTGHVFEGRSKIESSERLFLDIHRELFPPKGERPRATTPPDAPRLGDAELVHRAMAARNGDKFARLWGGDRSGYASPSEADLALCSLLSFFTQDASTIDRLFRQSGLSSAKWADRPDYRDLTIAKALERAEVYRPEAANVSAQNVAINPENTIYSADDDGLPGREGNKKYSKDKKKSPGDITAREDDPAELAWSPPRLEGPEPSPPFPLAALPPALQDLLGGVAEAMTCPVDFPALAALGIASGAMGRSVAIVVKDGWIECPSLYGGIVGHPGMTKSPPLNMLSKPLWDITYEQLRDHKLRLDNHRKYAKKDDPEPDPARRVVVDEVTVEMLAGLLGDNPRGLVMVRDELSGLFGGMNQYKAGGKGNDRQFYLSAWSGSSVAVDRKSAPDRRPVTVSHPFLSIIGGLTPDMLSELGEGKGRDDGFLDRVIFAAPERVRVRWTDRAVPPEAEAAWRDAIERLWAEPMAADVEGRPRPWFVRFTPDAAAGFAAWFDAHEEEAEGDDFPGYLRGPWAKFRAYAARLSLLVDRLGRSFHADGLRGEPRDVGVESLSRGLILADYFKAQTRRVRAMMRGSFGDCPPARKVLDWAMRRHQARFRAAEVRQNFRHTFPVDGPELDRALAWLTARHCIRPAMPAPRHGPGRAASPEYELNPALLGDIHPDY